MGNVRGITVVIASRTRESRRIVLRRRERMACRTGARAWAMIDKVTGVSTRNLRTGAAVAVQSADMGMESCIDHN